MPDENEKSATLTFWEHFDVLRTYILIGGFFFFACSFVLFGYSSIFTYYLLKPLHGQTLVFLSPMGPFLFEIRLSFIGAAVVSFPLWLFLLSRFAGDALPKRKRWRFQWFVLVAALAGFGSFAVGYLYLVPVSFHSFSNFVVPGTSLMLTADSYVNFFILVTTVCFVVVELPVVITALAYLRLVNPYTLAQHRRWLFVGLLILLGLITPTADAITLLAVTIPAMGLAELGLVVAKFMYNRETV